MHLYAAKIKLSFEVEIPIAAANATEALEYLRDHSADWSTDTSFEGLSPQKDGGEFAFVGVRQITTPEECPFKDPEMVAWEPDVQMDIVELVYAEQLQPLLGQGDDGAAWWDEHQKCVEDFKRRVQVSAEAQAGDHE